MLNNKQQGSDFSMTPMKTCDLIWIDASEILTTCLFASLSIQNFSDFILTG